MNYNDVASSTPPDIVGAFANYFSSVFVCSGDSHLHSYESFPVIVPLPSLTTSDVLRAFAKLPSKLSSGIDNIPAVCAVCCKHELV